MRVPLISVCDFHGGSQPPKEEWLTYLDEGYIRMLQIRDFTQTGRFNPEYVKISNSTKTCNEDDILIARYGASIGKVFTGLSGAYNVAIMKTIPDISRITKPFLFYYLNSDYVQKYIQNVGSRAAQAGFNKEELSKLIINLPSLGEQQLITFALEKATMLISLRKQQLEKLDELVKSQFIEMFGDPVANPMRWEVKPLGCLCDKMTDGEHQNPGFVEAGIKMVMANNVREKLSFENCKFISLSDYQKFSQKCNPTRGDVLLVSRGATVGRCCINDSDEPFSLMGSVIFIKCNKDVVNQYFLCSWLQNCRIAPIIATTSSSTAQQAIYMKDLKNTSAICPPLDLQNQFAAFVQQVDKSKFEIRESLDKLETLYKALMQQYFG